MNTFILLTLLTLTVIIVLKEQQIRALEQENKILQDMYFKGKQRELDKLKKELKSYE